MRIAVALNRRRKTAESSFREGEAPAEPCLGTDAAVRQLGLFDLLIRPRPLRDRSAVAAPPGAGLFLRPAGGGVLPRLLSAVGGEIEQLQRGQHRFDASPLRFVCFE